MGGGSPHRDGRRPESRSFELVGDDGAVLATMELKCLWTSH